MLNRKESSYSEEKLVQNFKNTKELGKPLKSLGLNVKEGNKAKVCLNKDGPIQFEPRENEDISKKFYSEIVTNPVVKMNNCS